MLNSTQLPLADKNFHLNPRASLDRVDGSHRYSNTQSYRVGKHSRTATMPYIGPAVGVVHMAPRNPRQCDVPHCENVCVPTETFDNTNITCMACSKFHCSRCTEQIWTGEWNGEVFYKPNLVVPGHRHEVFRCAFCRASFDRITEVTDAHSQ